MQVPPQLTFHGLPSSPAVEADLRERVAKLEHLHAHIVSCHVTVEVPHRHRTKGNLFSVRVDVKVPDGEIVVSHEHHERHAHEDLYVAARDAFAAVSRRLEDDARRHRRRVKHHAEPEVGHVTKLFRESGYGFLETPLGDEVYFHEHAVAQGAFLALQTGQRVRFTMGAPRADEGPQASLVVPQRP